MIPKLRFPEFSGDWQIHAVGKFIEEYNEKSVHQDQHEVLTSSRSGLVRQRDYFDNDRIAERDNIGFNVIPPNFLTYRSRSDDRRFYFNKNDLNLTGIVSIYYPVFQIKNGSNKFFIELLSTKSHYLGKFSVGTSQTVLSLNELRRVKLAIPEAEEQEKIAAFLSAVDERIKLMQRRLVALQRYKKGAMQRLFAQTIRFKRDDGTTFPDWVERTIGSVFDWVGTNSLSREMLTSELGSIQNIHYGDIHGRFPARFKQSEQSAPFIKPDALTRSIPAEQYCAPGDVIIADASEDYADIGKSIEIIEVRPQSLVAGLHTHLARPKANTLALGFSGYLFQTWTLRNQIMRIAQGISVLGISKTNLSKLTIELPHLDEQRKISDFLGALDDKVAVVSAKIDAMQTFKKGLLQQMFV